MSWAAGLSVLGGILLIAAHAPWWLAALILGGVVWVIRQG